MFRNISVSLLLSSALLNSGAQVATDPSCISDSIPSPQTFIRSWPCAEYHLTITRYETGISGNDAVTVDYFVHRPAGQPGAVVMLFAGGLGDAGLVGDPLTAVASSNKNNFLVRSGQLFAEAGYLVVTTDRPSDEMDLTYGSEYDAYRLSARHTFDIAKLLNEVNLNNLDVFLAGTSRGAMSAVSNADLSTGISISSPVTSGGGFPVGSPQLPPEAVTVPAHVLYHPLDGCAVTTPTDSINIFSRFTGMDSVFSSAGVSNTLASVSGGFTVSSNPCKAKHYHGFLGRETAAVTATTGWMDIVLNAMATAYPTNQRPLAASIVRTVPAGQLEKIDLTALVYDPDGDVLSYRITHATTFRGGSVSITGSVISYTSPVGPDINDGLVYIVEDEAGARAIATIDLLVKAQPSRDINQDGFIDSMDLGALMSLWGPVSSAGDFNISATTDTVDLSIFLVDML